jgi:hypothetical protein
VSTRLLPMSDLPVRTVLDCDTAAGPATLNFQDYFVRQRAEPRVKAIHYQGASQTPPAATLAAALTDPDLAAIFIAPSNPWLSIEPILAIPSIRAAVRSSHAPVVAVSPIVAGQALKGSDREDHERTRPATLGPGGRAQELMTRRLIEGHPGGLSLCPAARDGGSNALLLSPPTAMPFLYGPQRKTASGSRAGPGDSGTAR